MGINRTHVEARIGAYTAAYPDTVAWMNDMIASEVNGIGTDEEKMRHFIDLVGDGQRCAELIQLLSMREITRLDSKLCLARAQDTLEKMDQLAKDPQFFKENA